MVHLRRMAMAGVAVAGVAASILPSTRSMASPVIAASPCATGAFCSTAVPLDAPTRAAMVGVTWHRGCPVPLSALRVVELSYWGFDDSVHVGRLVVHRDAVGPITRVFAALFAARFAIDKMVPIEAYGGDDDASTKANNTSAFNCRPAYGSTTGFSQHAFGRAVDINPVQNPYVRSDGTTLDPVAQRFADRSAVAAEPGVITNSSPVVRAFAAQRWGWGGRFRTVKDYQHFAANGR